MNDFDTSFERLDRFIWYLARRWGQSIEGMDAHDLHQIGLMKLYKLTTDGRYTIKPAAEFDLIFKRALFNALMDEANKSKVEQKVIVHIDLVDVSEAYGYDAFDEFYLRHYQQHLESMLSPDAATLLEYLLNPTPAIYHMHEIQRMRRETLRSQGFNVHIPRKLTQVLVGKTIGFSTAKTKSLIREIQGAWAKCRTSNWRLNAVTP